MKTGKLILLPNVLDESCSPEFFLPAGIQEIVGSIEGLIVESEKEGRRFLRRFLTHEQMAALPLKVLNEHTTLLEELLMPLLQGETWGLISDGGLSCIADPGSDLVWEARERGVEVATFPGPCSFLMALQLSGFSGQNFSFHGYLPRELVDLEKKLRELEDQRGSQIWIEAPYRSGKMIETLLRVLQSDTRLCVAVNLTGKGERVYSAKVEKWRGHPFVIGKEPAIFLINRA